MGLLLPAALGDSFRVADARGAGVGEGRLRGRDLERPFHGSRILAPGGTADRPDAPWELEARDLRHRILAYRPLLPAGAFFAGPTAAFLHGLPLTLGIHDRLHVGVLHPRTAPHRPGIRGVQVLPRMASIIELDGMPVTDLATTWAMLGPTLGLYDLVAVADALLRVPRHPGGFRASEGETRAARAQLGAALEAGRRPGAPRLRTALGRARTGASSRAESWMRLVLVDGGLPEPALDVDVHDAHGRFLGCSELAYPAHLLAIEYESDGHLTRRQLERDIDKYTDYAAAGWRTVRLTSSHVFRHPREAVRRVSQALRGSSP